MSSRVSFTRSSSYLKPNQQELVSKMPASLQKDVQDLIKKFSYNRADLSLLKLYIQNAVTKEKMYSDDFPVEKEEGLMKHLNDLPETLKTLPSSEKVKLFWKWLMYKKSVDTNVPKGKKILFKERKQTFFTGYKDKRLERKIKDVASLKKEEKNTLLREKESKKVRPPTPKHRKTSGKKWQKEEGEKSSVQGLLKKSFCCDWIFLTRKQKELKRLFAQIKNIKYPYNQCFEEAIFKYKSRMDSGKNVKWVVLQTHLRQGIKAGLSDDLIEDEDHLIQAIQKAAEVFKHWNAGSLDVFWRLVFYKEEMHTNYFGNEEIFIKNDPGFFVSHNPNSARDRKRMYSFSSTKGPHLPNLARRSSTSKLKGSERQSAVRNPSVKDLYVQAKVQGGVKEEPSPINGKQTPMPSPMNGNLKDDEKRVLVV